MNSNDMSGGLHRLCRVVRAGAALGAVCVVTASLGLWADPDLARQIGSSMAGLGCQPVTVDARTQWLGAGVSVLPAALGLAFFVLLWRLFGEYAAGRALTAPAQRLLQRLAQVLLVIVVLQPLMRGVYSVVMTIGNGPGQRHLVLGFGSDDYFAIIVALALLAIATVMRQAVQAAEENRGFV